MFSIRGNVIAALIAMASIFSRQGLLAGISIEGTKISRIER